MPSRGTPWRLAVRALEAFNTWMGYASGVVIFATSLILVYEVLVRYLLKWPTDWEIELSVMLLIVATFMSAAYTQLRRGHVTIEVLEHVLPSRVNQWRLWIGDLLSLGFCAFVAYTAWHFFWGAWTDGRVSNSAWAPRLWMPYSFMAIGMSTLSLQLLVQVMAGVPHPSRAPAQPVAVAAAPVALAQE